MSLPNVGDLAYVVHSHCEQALQREGGSIERVLSIEQGPSYIGLICGACGEPHSQGEAWAEVRPHLWHPLKWLTRIPPLSESERETLTESEVAKHPAVVKVVLWDDA